MRLLICGDRKWRDIDLLWFTLDNINGMRPITLVIEGGANGADIIGKWWAQDRGIPFTEYPANWAEYHRAAGPIRNQQMITEGKPDAVAAFHSNLSKSKGTADMLKRARREGLLIFGHIEGIQYLPEPT